MSRKEFTGEDANQMIVEANLYPSEVYSLLIGVLVGLEETRPGITKRTINAILETREHHPEAVKLMEAEKRVAK